MCADVGLSRCLNAAGGMTLDEACARGDANVAKLSERGGEVIKNSVATLADLISCGAPCASKRAQMHRLSCDVAGVGGVFGRAALSQAAYSFCRLLDETEPGWAREAVLLHAHVMRLLCTPENIPESRQAELVDGLVKVRRRLARERESLHAGA